MMLGEEVEMRDRKAGKTVRGTCTGVKRGDGPIYNMKTGEEWPSVRFRIKPDDGSRAIWSPAYPDKKGEYSDLKAGEVRVPSKEPSKGGGS